MGHELGFLLREQLRLEISTLARDNGATSVYITHDQAEAFALADAVGVLCEGRLLQLGRPEELYLRPASPVRQRFVEQQQPHPANQRPGQRDALLLAAGELVWVAGGQVAESHSLEHRRRLKAGRAWPILSWRNGNSTLRSAVMCGHNV